MASEFQNMLQSKGVAKGKSIGEIVSRYWSHYPLFLAFLTVSFGIGFLYTRYAVPLYQANTTINVKGETTASKHSSAAANDLINNAMNGGRAVINLDNELARLRSAKLMERVVRHSDQNISYFREGDVRKTDVYLNAPFRLLPRDIQDSSRSIGFTLTQPTSWGVTLHFDDDLEPGSTAVKWNTPFRVHSNTYMLVPLSPSWNDADQYSVEWSPVQDAVYALMPRVSVNVLGKTTNIGLSISIENPLRGEDILDKMVTEFVGMNLEDQNRAAQGKIYFIEERLGKIASELKGVEKNLSSFQGNNLLVRGQDAGVEGEPIPAASKAVADLNAQMRILALLRQLLADPGAHNKVLPSTLGLNDAELAGLISKFNNLVLIRQRETPLLAPSSLVLKDLDTQIAAVKDNMLVNIKNLTSGMQIQLANHQSQGSQYKASVSVLPEKHRVLEEISREKSVKENLYMYLLQKREEAALSRSSTSPYEQIDLASSIGPVSPNPVRVYQLAFLLGLVLPIGVIYFREVIAGKVSSPEEAQQMSGLPLAGEVGYQKTPEKMLLPGLMGGLLGEQFRSMRANFEVLNKENGPRVLMITSSISGEGKSFISRNLAALLARAGRKVALLEFDLRGQALPGWEAKREKGLSDFLLGEAPLGEICQSVPEVNGLYVYPSGKWVPDAGDLLVHPRMDYLFEELRKHYDIILVDSPPARLVSDALVLEKYCNVTGYVVREGYTPRKHLDFLHSLLESGKLKNAFIICNGVKNREHYGYYPGKNYSYFNRKGNSPATFSNTGS
ncbi:AAA family ATPase [Paraflavisolibacter sp. H34]|uniref:GumC family protein n=1 Tax=Huijunlia imazamoxiresistens TaxID=3127457 RepID=UPI0030164EBC